MKKRFSLVLLMILTTLVTLWSQDTPQTPRLKLEDVYLFSGQATGLDHNLPLSDLQKLAPSSLMLKNDFSGFSSSNNVTDWEDGGSFSAGIGYAIYGKGGRELPLHPQLRIGFHFAEGTSFDKSFYKEYDQPFDTLISTQTGQEYLIDTFSRTDYSIRYRSSILCLDISYLLRYNPAARWNVYAGAGIRAGMSIENKLTIDRWQDHGTRIINGDDYYTIDLTSENLQDNETFFLKQGFDLGIYAPLGVDFRVGRKQGFFKHLHLFYQMNPQLNIQQVPELRTFSDARFHQGAGIRFTAE